MPSARILDLHWNALLANFRRSGLTQAEFFQCSDLSIYTFRKHLYAARVSRPTPPAPHARPRPGPRTSCPSPSSPRAATAAPRLLRSS